MPVVVAVAFGGAAGALARLGADSLVERHVESLFPWSTFVINVSGCFLNGLLVALVVDTLYELTELGHWGIALANIAVSAAVGVAAVALGQALGRLA